MGTSFYNASKIPATSAFMADLTDICKKHGLCIVPVYEGQPTQHDSMHVMPFNGSWQKFYKDSISVEMPNEEDQ